MNASDTLPQRRIGRNPLSPADRRNRYAGIAAALLLILYAFFLDPEKASPFKCDFKEWTGRNCFACGLSHSLHASATLDWVGALHYHIFGPVLFLSAWILSVYWILELAVDRKGPVRGGHVCVKVAMAAVASAWFLYWLYRLVRNAG